MNPNQAINASMGWGEWGVLLGLTAVWSLPFFFVEIALTALPPFTVVWLRVALAALALNLLVPLTGRRLPRQWAAWRAFFAMGLLNNLIPFSLIVWGQTQLASGLAAILNAMTPVMTVIVAHFLTVDEKITPARLAGVLAGFGGVAVMIGPDALQGLGAAVLAQLAVLGATVSYGFAGAYGRRFRRMRLDPVIAATGQLSASALLLLPLTLAVERPWSLAAPPPPVWAALAGLALLSTALAYLLFFRLLASAGATNVMLVTFLMPVGAVWLGWSLLGEHLEARHLLGMALIGVGLAAIDGRLLRGVAHRLNGNRTHHAEPAGHGG